MNELIKSFNKLQDVLTKLNVHQNFDLPQIAVVGGQSVGKSSVLESFVGEDFLPRGTGIVTRRPLILQLIHTNDKEKKYGEFLHSTNKSGKRRKWPINKIREEIEEETERGCGNNKGISDTPISLRIYSSDVLDLTLVDLPGMARVPVGDQPADIEQQIKRLVQTYINKPNCLILAVSAANADLATSDALRLAQDADPNGERTIGVLTKLDMIGEGQNARDILLNKVIPLRRGYIGVKSRSQNDIDKNVEMTTAAQQEEEFFGTHYSDLANRHGSKYLQRYLSRELGQHIRKTLPHLLQRISDQNADVCTKLEGCVEEMDESTARNMLTTLCIDFKEMFESKIEGASANLDDIVFPWRDDSDESEDVSDVINITFPADVDRILFSEDVLRKEIRKAIKRTQGIDVDVFPNNAFRVTVQREMKKFVAPSQNCAESVTGVLGAVVVQCAEVMHQFPKLRMVVISSVLNKIAELKKNAKDRITEYKHVEASHINVLHKDFIDMTDELKNLAAEDSYSNENERVSAGNRSFVVPANSNGDTSLSLPLNQTADIVLRAVISYLDIMKENFKHTVPNIIIYHLIMELKKFLKVLSVVAHESGGVGLMTPDPMEVHKTDELKRIAEACNNAIRVIHEIRFND